MKLLAIFFLCWIAYSSADPTVLDEQEYEHLLEDDILEHPSGRKAVTWADLWDDGIVPYRIDASLTSNNRLTVASAMQTWEDNTCVTFRDVTYDASFDITKPHLNIHGNTGGCYSYIGKLDYPDYIPQEVGLGKYCAYKKTALHELAHAMGISHEQNRNDRDQYVNILAHNVQEGKILNFDQYTVNTYSIPYDFLSVMQYGPTFFANGSTLTIQSKDLRYQYVMGKGQDLTFGDIKVINMLYCSANRATDCNLSSGDVCNAGFLKSDCTCECPQGTSGDKCQFGQQAEISTPCGSHITSAGTYSTPGYPSRSTDWYQRSCVWTIKAPLSTQKVKVQFTGFSFHCYYDKVEVRTDGLLSESQFYCGQDLLNQEKTSTQDEMAILISSRSHYYGNGMQFTVSFV